jgi:hypothetical protein
MVSVHTHFRLWMPDVPVNIIFLDIYLLSPIRQFHIMWFVTYSVFNTCHYIITHEVMTQPRYIRIVICRDSQCLINASNRLTAPICTTFICNSLSLIPLVNNCVHMYIYFQLDVNESRQKYWWPVSTAVNYMKLNTSCLLHSILKPVSTVRGGVSSCAM